MQQLSRPYQIALGALLVFALAWFTVLKPSAAAEEPAPPAAAPPAAPGAAGLGRAVDKAKGAAAASDANAAAAAAAQGEPAAPTAAAPRGSAGADGKSAAKRKPAAKGEPAAKGGPAAKRKSAASPRPDPSAPLLRAVARGKVAVLLFYSREAADDRAVRRALRAANRHDGRVVVRAASIARVAEYAAITQGVDVLQAPTLLVIGKDNRARSLVGFTDTRAIDQLVADVGHFKSRR